MVLLSGTPCSKVLSPVLTDTDNIKAKMVLSADHERLVSWIVFKPPGPPDTRTEEEKSSALQAYIKGTAAFKGKEELVYNIMTENRVLDEKFLGKGYESRFWEVSFRFSLHFVLFNSNPI
jgi:hypothetical protein